MYFQKPDVSVSRRSPRKGFVYVEVFNVRVDVEVGVASYLGRLRVRLCFQPSLLPNGPPLHTSSVGSKLPYPSHILRC
jgi:hypothetical protein